MAYTSLDELVNQKANAYRQNPEKLGQRAKQNEELLDMLAGAKVLKEKEAAKRQLAMEANPNPNTLKDQIEQQLMQRSKDEMVQQVSGTLQQKNKQQQKNMQNVAKQGAARPQDVAAIGKGLGNLAGRISPKIANMAAGGIVSFQEGRSVTAAMIAEYRRKYPNAVKGMTDEQVAQLIRPSGPVRGDSEEGQRRLDEMSTELQQKADAEAGDPMPGPKERPSMIGPYEAEEGAYPFPSNQGIRIGAKDFDKDIIKGAQRTKDFMSGLLPDLSGGPAGFFRDKKAAQEEQQRIADISPQASPEATAMADAERKQMTGTAPAMQPPAEQAGLGALSQAAAKPAQGPEQDKQGIMSGFSMKPVAARKPDYSKADALGNQVLDKYGLNADKLKDKDAEFERMFKRTEDIYNRQGVADRYKAFEDERKALADEMYDPNKMREERISAFLRGTAGRGSTALAGGSGAMAAERQRQEAGRIKALEDRLGIYDKSLAKDFDIASKGVDLGKDFATLASNERRTAAEIFGKLGSDERTRLLKEADMELEAGKSNLAAAVNMAKVESENALRLAIQNADDRQASLTALAKVNDQKSKILEAAFAGQAGMQYESMLAQAAKETDPEEREKLLAAASKQREMIEAKALTMMNAADLMRIGEQLERKAGISTGTQRVDLSGSQIQQQADALLQQPKYQ